MAVDGAERDPTPGPDRVPVPATGVRIGWWDLPERVRVGVEDIVGGGPVVAAQSQAGGFSPGTAARVRTAGGRCAFVKAVSPDQNAWSPGMHRREAAVTARLPPVPWLPRLLGCYDDGHWVALVLADVAGHQPVVPWQAAELDRCLATLRQLARDVSPADLPDLESGSEGLRHDLAGWERVLADPPPSLQPWARDRLPGLATLAAEGIAALRRDTVVPGDVVVHGDVRADNLLLRPDGTAVLVDWPAACTGPAWLDLLLLAVNVDLHGGHDVDRLLLEDARGRPVDQGQVTAVLAGLAGYFVDAARRPAPPGLPTVRAFQAAQAASTLAWLRRRRGVGGPSYDP